MSDIVIFALDNSKIIGEAIAKKLSLKLSAHKKTVFKDGEIMICAEESVRDRDVFLICSATSPVNDSIMEILIFMDALKRASAKNINVVMTYYGYARQDRKSRGRQPITAKLMADLLTKAGLTKLITIDLHNPSIQGFFDKPVDDLRGQFVIAKYISSKKENFIIVAPDSGGVVRANIVSDLVSPNTELAIIDKKRGAPNVSSIRGIIGDVKDKNCIIIDDMIDTGGTILNAAKLVKKEGAKKVIIAATHGIFSAGFLAFDEADFIDEIIVTDTIQSVIDIKSSKITIVSLVDIITDAIKATFLGTSVSALYKILKDKITKIRSKKRK